MGRKKKYLTEEEKKAANREYQKRYREAHPDYWKNYWKNYYQEKREELLEYQKQYRQDNPEKVRERHKEYYNTPMGRAVHLISAYQRNDKEHNRGECTLTTEWVMENIFTKPCHYCGETDWLKIGCDRVDNSKPHTPDNVVPCCEECNTKRQKMEYEEFKEKMLAEQGC